MSLFQFRKPSGFHHTFIYVDERRERIEELKKRALEETETGRPSEHFRENFKGTFSDAARCLRRRKNGGVNVSIHFKFGLIIFLIIVLALLWCSLN